METTNINKLKEIEKRRNELPGYKVLEVRIKYERKHITTCGPYENSCFDEYILKAISEKEQELIKRAFELEEIYYLQIKQYAKLEAAKIISLEE